MMLIRPTITNSRVWKIEIIFETPQPLDTLQRLKQAIDILNERHLETNSSTLFYEQATCNHKWILIPIYQFGEMTAVVRRCTYCGYTIREAV